MKQRELPVVEPIASGAQPSDTPPGASVRGLSLRANFSWTFVSNIVYAACQWGMLVALAKLGSPEMVGQFTLGLAVTTPVISLGNLQLRNIQATDAKDQYRFGDYLGLRLVTVVLGLLAMVAIVVVSGYRGTLAAIVLVIGLAKAFEAISDIFYGLLQQRERMDRIATSMMIRGFLSLVALSATIFLTGSVFWGVVSLAVVWGAILVIYDLRGGGLLSPATAPAGGRAAALGPRWDRSTLTRLVWLALPLGLVQMLVSLNASIAPYFIQRHLGGYELGIFAAIVYIERAETLVVSALGGAASPRLSKYYAAGDSVAFRALLLKVAGVGATLGIGGVLVALVAGREILTLLYRPEYARYDVFVGVMVVVGITNVSWFLGYAMTAARYFRAQLPLFALVTATMVLAGGWLIPTAGLRGAVTALFIAAVVQTIGGLAVMARALFVIRAGRGGGGRRG